MRMVRAVALVVGAVVALVILAMIAVLAFVDPNRYRGDIERVAQEHTSRALTIRGKLQLKVFPWLALSVHDVQLSNRPGFGAEPFMTVQNVSIGVKVLPLLAKRLEVSRVALDGVTVHLVSRGSQNNWQDLSSSEGSPAVEKPSRASTPEGTLSIEGVDLSQSSVLYQDELKQSTTEISNLELHTGRLTTGPAGIALGSVQLQGAYLKRTSESAGPTPVAFSLRTSGLSLDSASQTLAPAKIELQVGDSRLDVSLSGEKMSTERLITGTVAIPTTSPRKLLQSLGITPPVTRDTGALSAFALQTNFQLTVKQLQLSGLQLTLDETTVRGTAAIDDLDHSAVSFDLAANTLNLDRYRGPATGTPATRRSPGPAKLPTPLPLESLRKLNLHGTLRLSSATVSNVLFTDLVIPLTAKDGHIRLGPTEAHLYGGSCDGDIVLDAQLEQAQLSLNQHVHDTDIGALVKAAFESARLSGRADVDAAVAGVGNTDEAILRSLNGKIDTNVKQGAFTGIDVAYELERVNALLKREAAPQRTGPARTVFNTLRAPGTLDKGVLQIDPLQIETDFLKVHGGGTLDTVTEAINYQLVATGAGLDALKSVEVPLTITGTLSNPAVRPDIGALAKGKLGQEVQQKAGELVKKKLGDKLKDLFGR